MYQCAEDGKFALVNPALVAMLGYDTADEVVALNPRRHVFRDAAELERLLASAEKTGRIEGVEVSWERRDGSTIAVRISGHAVPEGEGGAKGFECIAEDVTERRSLERQLQLSQKMEAIGRLAGGIAHDFNNLLVAILGYSDVLTRQLPEGHRLKRHAEEIHKAGERAASLTRQLLAFSRAQVIDRKPLDLSAVVTDMVPMLRRLIGEDVGLVTLLDPHRVRVLADRGQVEQILLNLVVNARDAMPRGGTLTIETRSRAAPATLPASLAGAGPCAMLCVVDTGEGMTPEVQARLFEPFFTTKPPGQGTGLGLSTLYGIVKQNAGDVSVWSEVGRGSRFCVFLPRTEAPIELSPSAAPDAAARPRTETLLLVEDDPSVRQIAREILETDGYRVLEAKDGADALRLVGEFREPLRLMVTDLVLPDTTGLDLAERLQEKFPDLRVLLTSGYTAQTLDLHGLAKSRAAFLPKPFRPDELLRKVRKVLDATVPPRGA
jgi:PAS domain S-box-containing protein